MQQSSSISTNISSNSENNSPQKVSPPFPEIFDVPWEQPEGQAIDRPVAQQSPKSELRKGVPFQIQQPAVEPPVSVAQSLLVDPTQCGSRESEEQANFVCDPERTLSIEKSRQIELHLAVVRQRCRHPCGGSLIEEEGEEEGTAEVKEEAESTSADGLNSVMDPSRAIGSTVPCRIGVAVVKGAPKEAGLSGHKLAEGLLNKWKGGLGTPGCDDGVIIAYSASDHRAWVAWNPGEEVRLSQQKLASMTPLLNSVFQAASTAEAVAACISIVEGMQSGQFAILQHCLSFERKTPRNQANLRQKSKRPTLHDSTISIMSALGAGVVVVGSIFVRLLTLPVESTVVIWRTPRFDDPVKASPTSTLIRKF